MKRKLRSVLMVITALAIVASLGRLINPLIQFEDFLSSLSGVAYTPYRLAGPSERSGPTIEQINSDFRLLREYGFHSVRTYGLAGILSEIPGIAEKNGLKLTLGIWLDLDVDENEMELGRLGKNFSPK